MFRGKANRNIGEEKYTYIYRNIDPSQQGLLHKIRIGSTLRASVI